ncbi:MAG: transcriptional repressor [Candidatus Shapirobacteria bacterium]
MLVKDKIIEIVAKSSHPLTAGEIQDKLKQCDRATTYRTLAKLKEEQLVRIIEIGDGVVRYESQEDHHHHLICLKCKEIERIDLPKKDEKRMHELQSDFQKKSKFSFLQHSLEFFGLCVNCKKL